MILYEMVPLVLKECGLFDQAVGVATLSGDLRFQLLELYSILDQVMLVLDIDGLDSPDLNRKPSQKDMSAFNCISDACYVLMMFNDAKSYTSADDIAYFINFAEDFAQSSIKNAAKVTPKSWRLIEGLTAAGIIELETTPQSMDAAP